MSLFKRPLPFLNGLPATILVCSLTLAAGCGFKPLYGVDSASHAPGVVQQFSAIEIPVYPDRIGQQIRNMLIDELHPSGAAADYRYTLNVTTREADIGLGLQANSTSTRGEVKLTSEYRLIDKSSGKVLLHETLRTSTGYNILVNQFGSVLSNEDARQNGLQEIADEIATHLALYFNHPTS